MAFIVHLEFSMFAQQKIPTLGPADSYEIPTRGPKIHESMSTNDLPWRQDKRCISLKEAKNKNSGSRNEWTTVLSSQMRLNIKRVLNENERGIENI